MWAQALSLLATEAPSEAKLSQGLATEAPSEFGQMLRGRGTRRTLRDEQRCRRDEQRRVARDVVV